MGGGKGVKELVFGRDCEIAIRVDVYAHVLFPGSQLGALAELNNAPVVAEALETKTEVGKHEVNGCGLVEDIIHDDPPP